MSRAWAFEDVKDVAEDDLMLMYGWIGGKTPNSLSLLVFLPSVSPTGVFLLNRMAGLGVGGASS